MPEHHRLTKPLYTCTCSRFTGIVSNKGDAYNLDLPRGANLVDRIERTDYCKHVLAVMRVKGDPRYDEYVKEHNLHSPPLNHPNGMIAPSEGSTYSKGYKPGRGNPKIDMKNNLWGNTGMKWKKEKW